MVNSDKLAEELKSVIETEKTIGEISALIVEHGKKVGKRVKKEKKVKDPNAPKRPLSAYMEYLGDRREVLKGENPEMKSTELVSKMASEWRDLSDRSVWEDRAKSNKLEYALKLDQYNGVKVGKE